MAHVSPGKGWATCPITLNGTVRILTRPALRTGVSVADVTRRLGNATSASDHVFWPDNLNIASNVFLPKHIRGPNQITDVYLLGLALANGGRLVTFDTSIPLAAVRGANSDHLLILRNPRETSPKRTPTR